MGAFGSAILLFGIALFYVSTGTMNLDKLTNINFSSLSQLSVLIIFCGLAFKVALVPFHFWAPDVYEGTPTIYTGIMATIVKIGAFGAMYQFITLGSGFIPSWMFWLISLIALASMLLGNIMALGQTSMKRLLAYSSIVQAGFIVIGFINITPQNAWQVIYYLVAYTLASLVCFFSIHFIEEQKGTDQISAAENLYSENPFLAIVFSIALISLGGIPLTAGFMAKFFILNNAAYNNSITLVVIALVLAVVSMYYYFRLINMMFTSKISAINWNIGWMYQFLFVILSVLTIAFGTMPTLLVDWLK
jgi:NADH-quinone oxidoreductase subunit N